MCHFCKFYYYLLILKQQKKLYISMESAKIEGYAYGSISDKADYKIYKLQCIITDF